jgi:hypothetical protein
MTSPSDEKISPANPDDAHVMLTQEHLDAIFEQHYHGNAQVLTPEYNRAHIFREAIKKLIS